MLNNLENTRYVLASQSPRRQELLKKLGISFDVMPSEGPESSDKTDPQEYVMDLAAHKAEEILFRCRTEAAKGPESSNWGHPANAGSAGKKYTRTVIIGSDTIVVCDGRILGKPVDEDDARRMLHMLSGRTHQVYTGVAVIADSAEGSKLIPFYEKTDVSFYPLTDEEIDHYIASSDPMDKAGAYGIQGIFAPYVRAICGDYNCVVGFPLARLYHELKNAALL